jgi:high-affinity iron transporter
VILREGLEAALLVLMLLGMARKAGADRELRAVHAGWGLALLAGVATWFASGFIERMGGARREIMEGSVSLLAAAVLLMAGHWVLARIDARRRVDALKTRLKAADGGRGRAAVLVVLGFVAVYREAFEVVLFLRAIALDQGQAGAWVAAGAAAGLVMLIGLVAALSRLGHRLKPGPLLTGSGALLCVLSIVLAGKGIRSLQEAGVMPITPFEGPRVEWLGLFPTTQTLIAQLAVLAVFALVSMSAIRNLRGASQG